MMEKKKELSYCNFWLNNVNKLTKPLSHSKDERYLKNVSADIVVYLEKYGYIITSEIGRGGYGVVYKARLSVDLLNSVTTDKLVLNSTPGEDDSEDISLSTQGTEVERRINIKVAIKTMFTTAHPEVILSELCFLQILEGKDLTPALIDSFYENQKAHIVVEFFKHDLFINFFDKLTKNEIKYYMKSLLGNLMQLHKCGIVHRDIKPANFLYNVKKRTGQLIDFGLAEIEDGFREQILNREISCKPEDLRQHYLNIIMCESKLGNHKIGTEIYMPLESILKWHTQSFAVDMWSCGVIFLQILTKKYYLFHNMRLANKKTSQMGALTNTFVLNFIMELANIFGTRRVKETLKFFGCDSEFPIHMRKEMPDWHNYFFHNSDLIDGPTADLLMRLLELDPLKRISADEALSHEYFRNLT